MKRSIEVNETGFRELLEKNEPFRLLGGHIPYGVHTSTQRPYSYFTFLRDPVQWLISNYYKVIRTPKHVLHEEFVSENLSVNEGITRLRDNMQTRLIAGILDTDELKPEHLDIAKKNLTENIDVIGILEQYHESLIMLMRYYKWDSMPYYYRKNVGKNTRPKDNHTEETLEIARAYNHLDMELYAYGKELFAEELRRQGENFANDLQRFDRWNPIWSRWLYFKQQYLK